MSAFMVSKQHIDALVAVVINGPANSGKSFREWEDGLKWSNILPAGDANESYNALGDLMVRENLSSIHARYPDTVTKPENTPGPGDLYWLKPYLYTPPRRFPTILEALKLIACYEYQSCEHEEWKDSEAKRICHKLKEELITCLPGYEAAAWEWDKAKAAP